MSQTRGAYSVGGSTPGDGDGRRRGLGWLWWLLLALGLIALAAFLIARNANDAGDDQGLDVSDDRAAPGQADDDGPGAESDVEEENSQGAGEATTSNAPTTTAVVPSSATGSSPVVSEGSALLPPPANMSSFDGKVATATAVNVESVVSDEGFWIGSSPEERLFVRLATAGESPFQVVAGQTVTFSATVSPVPADGLGQWGVDAGEGAEQLIDQGYFLNVDDASLRAV
jgi:hypothetical protein